MLKVTLPKLTHDMRTARFIEWHRHEGDAVRRGDLLYAVETDKAAVDVEAEADGILGGISARPDDEIAIGQVIAYLLAPGEEAPVLPAGASGSPAVTAAPSQADRLPISPPAGPQLDPHNGGRMVATPLARRAAREMGIDPSTVQGSGPRGRVVYADVLRSARASVPGRETSTPPGGPEYEVIARTHVQVQTADRLVQMWQTTPQFVLECSADMAEAIRWREQTGGRMSYTALLVRAVAAALRRVTQVNSLWVGEELRCYRTIHVGIAMATGAGLVVPVIHHADRLTTGEIQSRLDDLRERAEAGRLQLADLSGGTFTLSNLGMYGVDAFTAVINPPQVAILACGRIMETPIGKQGQVVVRPMLCLRLTVDHRALDGAQAAPLLVEVKHLLENPYLLL
jgi:pyruvate dehydrogenase E2 component (dihydrolipoamide acetyltransferase)